MSIIIKETYVCQSCGSPYVDCHKYVRMYGFDASGRFTTDEFCLNDSDYCHACNDDTQTVGAILVYTPTRRLFELMPDYVAKIIMVYLVPHRECNGNVSFVGKKPKYLTMIGLNEFTQSVLQALMDESIPKQDRLNILGALIDL